MLVDRHDCFCILNEMQSSGIDVSSDIKEVLNDKVPKSVIKVLEEQNNPAISFYKNLNNKAHKIIKELLTCEGKSISTYIKIATSIITQSTISLEHWEKPNIQEQNQFIESLGLKKLTFGLHEYFTTGDYKPLVDAVNSNREDVKSILD